MTLDEFYELRKKHLVSVYIVKDGWRAVTSRASVIEATREAALKAWAEKAGIKLEIPSEEAPQCPAELPSEAGPEGLSNEEKDRLSHARVISPEELAAAAETPPEPSEAEEMAHYQNSVKSAFSALFPLRQALKFPRNQELAKELAESINSAWNVFKTKIKA